MSQQLSMARRQRRLGVQLEWALEDFADCYPSFKEILACDDMVTALDPIGDKFFFRVSFIGPIGTDNDKVSESLYLYLSESLENLYEEDLSGIAVNFVGGSYGPEG